MNEYNINLRCSYYLTLEQPGSSTEISDEENDRLSVPSY